MISIAVLSIVFLLIAIRQIGNMKLQIWQIMFGGAIAVLLFEQISFTAAFSSINFDVIFFLFGMFVVGQALEESGYLEHLTFLIFKKSASVNILVLTILFSMGIASAFLMNDTVAIIGTPIVLLIAKQNKINTKVLLLALAFGVTIGSVASPIGNPQNLIIAVNGGVKNSFTEFIHYLLVPTFINLFAAFLVLKIFFKREFAGQVIVSREEKFSGNKLSILSKISLAIIIILILAKIAVIVFNFNFDFRLTDIAIAACLPILLFSEKRFTLLRKVDWKTLIFFVSMFILMQSVWNSGFFQREIGSEKFNISSLTMIFLISVILSQFISNVPLVALYLPLLLKLNVAESGMMALAAGSTIAGNLFILGAASNVIIIQNAEMRTGDTLTFLDFAKVGIPLTALNLLVYFLYFKMFSI